MRERLAMAPTWVTGVVSGVFFAVCWTLLSGLFIEDERDDGWTSRIVVGVLAGVAFGVAMGLTFRKQRGTFRDEMQALSPDQRRAAMRAFTRGPAPVDPAARAAALNQARRNLEVLRRYRRVGLPLFAAFAVLAAVTAVASPTPWRWLMVVFWLAALAMQFWGIRRAERRVDELSR